MIPAFRLQQPGSRFLSLMLFLFPFATLTCGVEALAQGLPAGYKLPALCANLSSTNPVACASVISYKDQAGNNVHGYMAYVDINYAVAKVVQSSTNGSKGCASDKWPDFSRNVEDLGGGGTSITPTSPPHELAINANFFLFDASGSPPGNPHFQDCVLAVGLTAINGVVQTMPGDKINGNVSGTKTPALPDSLLVVTTSATALPSLQIVENPDLTWKPPVSPVSLLSAFSGILIWKDGADYNDDKRNDTGINGTGLAARTAIGILSDSHRIVIVVVEQSQLDPTLSAGINLTDLGQLVATTGATNVMNLDGGGSSMFAGYFSIQGQPTQYLSQPKDFYPIATGPYIQYRPTPVLLTFDGPGSKPTGQLPPALSLIGTVIPAGSATTYVSNSLTLTGAFSVNHDSTAQLRATQGGIVLGKNSLLQVGANASLYLSTAASGMSPNAAASLSTNYLPFQLQARCSQCSAASHTVLVTNAGSENLDISSISIAGSDPGDFSETDNCQSLPIHPLDSCSINVVFTHNNPQGGAAILQILSNAPSSPDSVQLKGETL